MLHVNEFQGYDIVAAYTSGSMPGGDVCGYDGNAVMIMDGGRTLIVSQPRSEGDILSYFPMDALPEIDLDLFFI